MISDVPHLKFPELFSAVGIVIQVEVDKCLVDVEEDDNLLSSDHLKISL